MTTSFAHSADGTRIAYEITGEGRPVILVDGAMCDRAGGPMRPIAAALDDRMRVLAYDRRGRGESGDTLPYDPAREVEDLAALIEVLGGEADLFAISSGVALAMRAAVALGSRVRRLALFEPPFVFTDVQKDAYRTALDEALAAGRNADAIALFMRQVGVPEEGIAGIRHSPGWPAVEALAPTLAYDDELLRDGRELDAAADAIAVPTLVLAGGASPAFLTDASERLARRIRGARFSMLPDQTHDVQAAVVAPVLVDFLA